MLQPKSTKVYGGHNYPVMGLLWPIIKFTVKVKYIDTYFFSINDKKTRFELNGKSHKIAGKFSASCKCSNKFTLFCQDCRENCLNLSYQSNLEQDSSTWLQCLQEQSQNQYYQTWRRKIHIFLKKEMVTSLFRVQFTSPTYYLLNFFRIHE